METLGLSSTPQKSDNIFQRLFWPTIHNQYDVDLLGQQGFWVCVVIGVLSGVLLLVTGQLLTGLITAFVFLAGACGVRQRSVLAAALVFTLYLMNIVASLALGTAGNPVIGLVCLMLLAANIRASVVSTRWLTSATPDADVELPERSTETITDKLANQLPVALWPKVKFIFFPAAAILIVLTLLGAIMLTSQKRRPVAGSSPSASLQVAPSR